MPLGSINDNIYQTLKARFSSVLPEGSINDYWRIFKERTLGRTLEVDFYREQLQQPLVGLDDGAMAYWSNQLAGKELLEQATLWLDADSYKGGQLWKNKGTGGSALDAKLGSVGATSGGAYIADGALNLPGLTGDYTQTPQTASHSPASGFVFTTRAYSSNWNTATDTEFTAGNRDNAGTVGGWTVAIYTGYGFMSWVDSGGVYRDYYSPGRLPAGAVTYWLRWTLNCDTGSSTRSAEVEYNASTSTTEPTTGWISLGAVAGPVTSVALSNQSLLIGRVPLSTFAKASTVYRAILKSISGSTVFDADFTTQPDGTTSFRENANGAVVTVVNSGADTNDPLFLRGGGDGYVYIPSTANWAYVDTEPAFHASLSSMEYAVHLDREANTNGIFGGPYALAGNGSYSFGMLSNGTLRLILTADGTSHFNNVSTAAVPYGFSEKFWVKMSWDDSGTIRFYTAPSSHDIPTDWDQLGDDVASIFTTIPTPASPPTWRVAGLSGSSLVGNYYRTVFWVNGAVDPILDVDFTTLTEANQSSFVCSTGQTVTFNRSTSGRKLVVMPRGGKSRFLFGTDDYFEIPDNALLNFGPADNFTVLALVREWGDLASATLISKKTTGGVIEAGWVLRNGLGAPSTTLFEISDGAVLQTSSFPTGSPNGALTLVAGVRSAGSDTLTTFKNSTAGTPATDTTTATLGNTDTVRIGRMTNSGIAYADMEFVGLALFRSALSAAELANISAHYGAM